MNRNLLFVCALVCLLATLSGCGSCIRCYHTNREAVLVVYPNKPTIYHFYGGWNHFSSVMDSIGVWTTEPVSMWATNATFGFNPSPPQAMCVAKIHGVDQVYWRLSKSGRNWTQLSHSGATSGVAYGFSIGNPMDGSHCLEVMVQYEDACGDDDPANFVTQIVQVPIKFGANQVTASWGPGVKAYKIPR